MTPYDEAQKHRQVLLMEKLLVEISNDREQSSNLAAVLRACSVAVRELGTELELPMFNILDRLDTELVFINRPESVELASTLSGDLQAPLGMVWRCEVCLKTATRRYGPGHQGIWDESCILRSKLAPTEKAKEEKEQREWGREVLCSDPFAGRGCGLTFHIRRDDVFITKLIHEGAVDECQDVCCPRCYMELNLKEKNQYHLPDEDSLPGIAEWAKAHQMHYKDYKLVPYKRK